MLRPIDARLAKLAPADVRPAARPRAAPLLCPNCGAPVPLAAGDPVTCVFCHTAVPLPSAYRELRDADRQRSADRAVAEALYRRIGRPPSLLLRTWAGIGAMFGQLFATIAASLLAVGTVGAVVLIFSLETLLHMLRHPLGIDLIDRFGGGHVYGSVVVGFFALGLVPIWLTDYLDEFVTLRKSLQAGLAAKPPARPGFPATCRECGAALSVPPNAYGVRCAYCQADNLVALPEAWLASARTTQNRFHGSIVAAVQQEKEVRAGNFALLGLFAAVSGVALLLFIGAGVMSTEIDSGLDDLPSFASSIGPPRALVEANSAGSRVPAGLDGDFFVGPMALALRKGETAYIASPDMSCVDLDVRNTTTFFPFLEHHQRLPLQRRADGKYGAELTADYTGLSLISLSRDVGVGFFQHVRWAMGHAPSGSPPHAPKMLVETGAETAPAAPSALFASYASTAKAALSVGSPGRKDLIVTAGGQREMGLWTSRTGERVGRLEASEDVNAVALGTDAAILASAGSQEIDIWYLGPHGDLSSTRWLGSMCGHAAPVSALAFLDDQVLASGDEAGHLLLWNAATGTELYEIPGALPAGVQWLGFSDDRRTLTAGFHGGTRRFTVDRPEAWAHGVP